MGSHPINLAFRFLLELIALFAFGLWAWNQADGWTAYALAFGLPLALGALWGIFAVPNDPSRSGASPVNTPGLVRILIELAFFSFATWCLKEVGPGKLYVFFCVAVFVHYLLSYDRIRWLLVR